MSAVYINIGFVMQTKCSARFRPVMTIFHQNEILRLTIIMPLT